MQEYGTQELCLLLWFVVGSLVAGEQYFWTYFGKYSAGNHYVECQVFFQSVLLPCNHWCCMRVRPSNCYRRAYSRYHSKFSGAETDV